MKNLSSNLVSEIVLNNYRTADVFEKYGIDFCCHGNQALETACQDKNIKSSQVLNELNAVLNTGDNNSTDYSNWEPDRLAEHIENKHHRYVENTIPVLLQYLEKIARVHSENHPELLEVRRLFEETAGELVQHLKKEELMLFPYIKKMAVLKREGRVPDQLPPYGTVRGPIQVMLMEHDNAGDNLRNISGLTSGYKVPDDACNTYMVTMLKLLEFERDLHEHIHLENNILFPKAIELENNF